jgi:hypothetical protein
VRSNAGARVELRRRQAAERAAERDAAGRLLGAGPYDRVLDETETQVLLKLLTRALEARTVVAGRLGAASGASDTVMMRLSPSEAGSTVATTRGVLHLPGFTVELRPAARRVRGAS